MTQDEGTVPGEEENKLNPARIQGEGSPALAHFHFSQPTGAPESWQSPAQEPPGERSLLQGLQISGFPASNSIATSHSWKRSWTLAPFQPPSTKANRSAFQPSQRASPQAKRVLGLKCFFVNSTGGPMNSSSLPPLRHTLTTPPERETHF